MRGHAFAAVPTEQLERPADLVATLAREPGNPADPLAVAVWIEGEHGTAWRIGYLDRGVAARVGPRLDDGLAIEARLDGWTSEPEGRWQRPVVLVLPVADPADRSTTPGLWGRPPGVTRRLVRSG